MHVLVALFLLTTAQPPIIVIPKDEKKPEGAGTSDPPKIITIPADDKKGETAAPAEREKELAALKAEVARLTKELADEREQQKRLQEQLHKELADTREQLKQSREDLKALEAARRVEATVTEKPPEKEKPAPEKVVPAVAEAPPRDDKPTEPPAPTKLTVPPDRGLVRIKTANDVRILVNGVETKTTGTERVFKTPSLTPGQRYHYVVVAERGTGENPARVTRTVVVSAGTQTELELYP